MKVVVGQGSCGVATGAKKTAAEFFNLHGGQALWQAVTQCRLDVEFETIVIFQICGFLHPVS